MENKRRLAIIDKTFGTKLRSICNERYTWKEKTKDYEKIYREGVKAIKEINQLFFETEDPQFLGS
jgi:hypothetical protein